MDNAVEVRSFEDFDDPELIDSWQIVLAAGASDVIFMTREWQRTWWKVYGRGELILMATYKDGVITAIAPLFADGGMVFFVGSGGSDYLDFVGDVSDATMLDALLQTARDRVANFVGFRFYHVLDESHTGELLRRAAERLGFDFYDEGSIPAPYLDLRDEMAAARSVNKVSLRRHERNFDRTGELIVSDMRTAAEVKPHLEAFFAQHVDRWQSTPYPSLFLDSVNRQFFVELTAELARAGWLRFMRVDHDASPIAFHFGFCYGGIFFWYKPTFEVQLAHRSPGEVLLLHLLRGAIGEDARGFDFGLGDEGFKQRFATETRTVRTWGLYPR